MSVVSCVCVTGDRWQKFQHEWSPHRLHLYRFCSLHRLRCDAVRLSLLPRNTKQVHYRYLFIYVSTFIRCIQHPNAFSIQCVVYTAHFCDVKWAVYLNFVNSSDMWHLITEVPNILLWFLLARYPAIFLLSGSGSGRNVEQHWIFHCQYNSIRASVA